MRFDYFTPQKESVILDDDFLIHFNAELNEINYISASSFPIGFLSKDNIDLNADTKILNVSDLNHSMNIELLISNNQKEPSKRIILEFSKNPMNLSGFYLQDDSGQTTRIILNNIIINQPIEDSRFEVK
jgi:outer membrane lipoprotein-sorting protein